MENKIEVSRSPFPSDIRTLFVDSNIDTHLVIAVSLHDTISDVKAKIMAEHALCFQNVGRISIRAIKVMRRGFSYNLTDSLHVWNAFFGFKGTRWSVCIDVVPIHTVMEHHGGVVTPALEKNSGPNEQGSHNPNTVSRDDEPRSEISIDHGKDGKRKASNCESMGVEASDAMPATSTHKTISGKGRKTV